MTKFYFLFFTLLISGLSFSQEKLLNGDFESWSSDTPPTLSAWSLTQNIEQESTVIHGGSYAVKQTGGTSKLKQTLTDITPGNEYVLTLWYKVETGDGTDARIWSYWKDSSNKSIANDAGALRGPNGSYFDNNGNAWTQYTTTVVAPPNAASFDFEVRTYSGAIVYWDDFSFVDNGPSTDMACFDLSYGTDKFESVVVTPNSEGDAWTESSGTYSMNGYAGGAQETVEAWLIFGPLDLSSTNDLTLDFEASKQYQQTDLEVVFTSAYSGCPSSATWTTVQTITEASTNSVDLSAATGTQVFIGIKYFDDGADGYSSWSLSSVKLSATTCPTLGARPTSDCGTCDLTFNTETYTCLTNTSGDNNDGVTIEIPYIGSEPGTTVTTNTPGATIGGDNPATTADGTITISGLREGDAWNLTLNGGDCDGTSISNTVPSSICDPVTTDIIINEILADPDGTNGDANGDGIVDTSQDEFVEFYNTGSADIDISGFTIEDNNSTRHTFPDNTILTAGSFITVFGGGTPTGIAGIAQVASGGSLGLNNGGDTVTLKNGAGTVVITYTYGGEAGNNQSIARDPDFTGDFVQHLSHSTNPMQFTPGSRNDNTSFSTNEFNRLELKIYPNPISSGYLTIDAPKTNKISVSVSDLLGKQIIKNRPLINNRLDVSSLNKGLYIIKLSQDKAVVTKKLIIK